MDKKSESKISGECPADPPAERPASEVYPGCGAVGYRVVGPDDCNRYNPDYRAPGDELPECNKYNRDYHKPGYSKLGR